jgi:hypothetical protein
LKFYGSKLTVGEQHQLLPGPKGGDADLLEVLLRQRREGVTVNLVSQENVGVLGKALKYAKIAAISQNRSGLIRLLWSVKILWGGSTHYIALYLLKKLQT